MPLCNWLRSSAIALSCLGILIPTQCLVAQEPRSEIPPTIAVQPTISVDVALAEDGSFEGVVVDAAGQPKPNMILSVQRVDEAVATVTSNEVGEFRCQLDKAGVYLLSTGDHTVMMRCWVAGTAPPNARTRLMVQATDVVRGQIHPAACGLANPWIITGIVIAAIAIPVAIHNGRADRDDGS